MIGCQRATRPSGRLLRKTTLAWALAAILGMAGTAGSAQAARLGHARVVSAPGAPLQVLVPLVDLTPDEAANLRVSLADAAAWQQAGLQPPTPLADMHATLETGAKGSREVRITSSQPPATDAIDVLLDMQSNAGQRELQVTVLVPSDTVASGIRQARAGGAHGARAAGAGSIGHVKVLPGQALWGIASSHAVANATIYQELVALWRANPQAFIQNNMNLVRAGATLSLPDAATVQAIDPAEARRIFDEQAAAFQRYRGRLGAGGHGAVPVAPSKAGASGKVGAGQASNRAGAPSTQDQLRLSTPSQADAKADASTSTQHAMQDASKRIEELQSNVQALNQAAAGTAQQQGAAGTGQGGASSSSPGASSSSSGAANGAASGGASAGAASGAPGGSANGASGGSANGASAAAGAASSSGTAATPPVTGPSSPTATALDEAKDTAKQVVSKSGLADWLPDNLLVIVTAVLAIIIFIVAWIMRRAGQRRVDDDDSYGYGTLTPIDDTGNQMDIDRRISNIDLDLEHSHTEDRGHRT